MIYKLWKCLIFDLRVLHSGGDSSGVARQRKHLNNVPCNVYDEHEKQNK